jgi:hypothetical protein
MAAGYKHPKVKVHVGDGFKFLDDYKNTFDVIITDSSDPDGPAESLFQKPYFQLLHDALREGGVITTQGCRFSLITDRQCRAPGLASSTVFNMPASELPGGKALHGGSSADSRRGGSTRPSSLPRMLFAREYLVSV